MKKFLKWVLFVFLGLIALGTIVEATKSPEQRAAEAAQRQELQAQQAAKKVQDDQQAALPTATKLSVEAEEAEVSSLTGPQENAVRSARTYLDMAGFSRDGLIHQLSSDAGEGYDITDATIAVDSLNVDWNEQAVRSARQYLSMQGFSCKGLVDQLSSDAGEKYTRAQANYGAQQAGACN